MLIANTDVKSHIDLSTTEYDTLLTAYCGYVSAFFKVYLGKAIEEESGIVEYFDGDEIFDCVLLSNYPITTTTALQFQYRTGTYSAPVWNNFSADEYQVDTEAGIIHTDSMYGGKRNIKVTYSAGYSALNIPTPIKLAAIKLVAKIFNSRRSDGFKDESLGDASISWDKFLSDDIVVLLSKYKKLSL